MNYKANIKKNLKRYCSLRKINYSELARRTGIPLKTIQTLLYDNRRQEPRLSTIHAIAKALKVPIDKLLK